MASRERKRYNLSFYLSSEQEAAVAEIFDSAPRARKEFIMSVLEHLAKEDPLYLAIQIHQIGSDLSSGEIRDVVAALAGDEEIVLKPRERREVGIAKEKEAPKTKETPKVEEEIELDVTQEEKQENLSRDETKKEEDEAFSKEEFEDVESDEDELDYDEYQSIMSAFT